MNQTTHQNEPFGPNTELKRVLGLFSCTMLVIGNMIGVGIFTTVGSLANRLPAVGPLFLAWILGAFLAACGALSYAELGAAYPRAGGNYVFLKEAYGSLWGFLYGWTAAFITQAGTIAVLAVGCAKYAGIPPGIPSAITAISMIFIFGALNYRGVALGSQTLNAITTLKILCILGLLAAGLAVGNGQTAHFQPVWPSGGWTFAGLAAALIPVMYTYSGWNATVYVGSEVKNPSRTIPLSLLWGVAITAGLYLLLNVLYVYAMPVPEMRNEVAIARAASERLFGLPIGHMISYLIALSILGCVNATLLTAPRIPFAMARDGNFLKSFGDVHPRYGTPHRAILLEVIWACVLVVWATLNREGFNRLLDYVTVPSLVMNTLTVSAVFVLRRTQPDRPRPYKAWGYPLLPLCFVVMIVWILVSVLREEPRGAVAGLAIVGLGGVVYAIQKRNKSV